MMLRVLLTDPDQALLDSYEAFLSRSGFDVATAATGPQCLKALREWSPDVLVLEPDMPNGWGEQILKEVRERPETRCIPVLILSRRDRRAIAYPVQEYHVKPFSLGQLAHSVRSAAKAWRSPRKSPLEDGDRDDCHA